MTWRTNVCNQNTHNCRKGDTCRDTEECCFERDTPSGNLGNQGTCVAKGSCNYRTGLPTNDPKIPCSSQKYSEGYSEGYSSNSGCKTMKWIVLILSIVIILLIVGLVYYGMRSKYTQ